MTIWIPEYLKKNVTESVSNQTLMVDLPKNEQISHLHMEVSATNADNHLLTTLISAITKYEVIADGSKVLFSMEPELAYYIDFVNRGGVYPPMGFNYLNAARNTHIWNLCFGRYPFDEKYMLDTSLYNNVQLRIEYDISDSDYFTASSFRTNIMLYRPLEKLSPVGFIRNRAVRKETSNSAVETITHDLPMTFPLRYVACRFEDQDANIDHNCTAIKVNIDEGRLILADLNINEWMDLDKNRYPSKNYYTIGAVIGHEDVFLGHTNAAWVKYHEGTFDRAMSFGLYYGYGEQSGLRIWEADGTDTESTQYIVCMVTGPNPHKCLTIYDGREEPLDVARYTEGKVEYTLSTDETILHTFVQEVVEGSL